MPLAYNMMEPQWNQYEDWTCAACSLAWLNRALGIQYATEEMTAAEYIGITHNINATYGLMDSSGARLARCLIEQGAPAFTCWPTYSQAHMFATYMPLLVGGVNWNHWVGVRVAQGPDLALANSAPGWKGVFQLLTEDDWIELGPFAAVVVPLLRGFPTPPPPEA